MKYSKLVAAVVLSVLLVNCALAQPPGPPPGLGFGPPMGPPGRMFEALLPLVEIPEVQKELAIEDTQREKIETLQDDFRDQMQNLFREMRDGERANADGQDVDNGFDKIGNRMEELNKKSEAQLQQILTAKQWARILQLRLQRQGIAAFLRGEVAKELLLSEEQRKQIRTIEERSVDGFGPSRPNLEATAEAFAVLNVQQKATWSKLTGDPFTFPEWGGPPGFGGGPGGPMGGERKILKEYDKDGDKKLNAEEREAVRAALKSQNNRNGGRGRPRGFAGFDGPGGPRGRDGGRPPRGPGFGPGFGARESGKPGPKVSPSEVTPQPDASLYDANVLRTLFLDFENSDWENELLDFHGTDVEVPATLMVDGKTYPHVGVHFRGMSSFGGVPNGSKRSLNISVDFADAKQRLYGYKTLNLLNSHEDPTFLHTVLYSHIARKFIPAPKANFVKMVINGESWGVYVNVQQFDKIFADESFHDAKGTRWKVRGSPGGGGGLDFVGEDLANYKRRYEIKSKDDEKSWNRLITLCRTLNETPAESLEKSLEPMLDIDAVLRFLALDNALINCDGYWIRASDYSLFCGVDGRFQVVPHDMNEAFQAPMGPGMGRGGPGRAGDGRNAFTLDPLIGLNDSRKPLRSKLLAVPALRARYLEYVRAVAEELDWSKLGPVVADYQSLIEEEVEADTRKLTSFAAFQQSLNEPANSDSTTAASVSRNLRAFAKQRRDFLLNYTDTTNTQH